MLAIPVATPTPTVGSGHIGALEAAFRAEHRLLDDLLAVLLQQRESVGSDDLTALDDSVFAAQRVLHTLSEARRRRRALLSIVVGDEGASLGDLDRALGPRMTPPLRAALDGLQAAARGLAAELDRNRRVIQGALSSGDQLIRALTGQRNATAPVYLAPGGTASAQGPILVDRQV